MNNAKIIVFSAPSGGGKTTLIQALRQRFPHLEGVITHTTRPMREGEVSDVHYHFVDAPTFEAMIKNHEFIEWARVYDQYYGTSKKAVETVLQHHKTPILNVDWQGAQSVRAIYGKQALTIFILPPNLNELENRLKRRGDAPLNIQKRLTSATEEIAHADEYDHVVMNDDFNHAVNQLSLILQE